MKEIEYEKLSPEDFEIVGVETDKAEKLSKKSISFWQEVLMRFLKNKLALIGLITLVLIIIGAIFVPMFSNFTRSEEHTSELQSRFDLVCRLLLEKKKIN